MPAVMSTRPLDEWVNSRAQTFDIATLKNSAIGIHATHYLDLHLNHYVTKEPLLIALGGFPFALQANITRELQALKAADVTPVFVFDGLDAGKPYPDFSAQAENTKALNQAWEYYDQQQADQVVDAFSGAGSTHPESLYRFLQRILQGEGINFIVAPYAASAQLAYLEKEPHRFIDAVFGPTELFLFDVEKIITKMDTELRHFSWVTKSFCQEELGRLSNEQFTDLCLLLGSPFLPTFPPFETPAYTGKRVNIRDAIGMFNSAGRNALTLCSQFEEHQRVHELDYTDRFKRAFMTVKHHVIMDADGKVGPLDPENASSDLHELIGQRLPEELYFYISKGILGSRIPNWLTSGELLLTLPLGTEDTPVYRRLLTENLPPIRTQALCLLSNSLHRFYQTKVINVRAWYDDKTDKSIHLKDLPSVKDTISSWRLGGMQLPESVQKLQENSPLLTSCLSALKDQGFVSKSSSPKDAAPLTSKQEILSNVTWRFLQLRGYVDTKHQLTTWGKALESALASLKPSDNLEEPTFLAVELIRLGILSSKDWFPNISGGPMRGTVEEEQRNNLLVSRVACFGKIQHKPIGYSGPLSRQLLSFRALISTVRSTLRDLMEVILASLLLSGDANRDRDDWTELSLSLPFIDDNDCGLAIAVRTYLDDLPQEPEPTPKAVRDEVKAKGKEWFQHSHSFSENLDMSFHLWDAVYKAVQMTEEEPGVDSKIWDEANKWLSSRR
ncbi:hypothetical protein MferCBS49748_000731 [Microsporum ferrugineum]